jgi:hypothetical protein
MLVADQFLSWLPATSGVLPEAAAQRPWSKVGTQPVTIVGAGYRIANTTGTERLVYVQQAFPGDRPTSRPRVSDFLEMQLRLQGSSMAPTWGSDASPLGFYIDDGARVAGVSVGPTLQFIDPATGAVLGIIASAWSWLAPHTYALRKRGAFGWTLVVDGKELGTLGYDDAAATSGVPTATGYTSPAPAHFGWGALDVSGLATGTFDRLEVGLNADLPPQGKVDRLRLSMPAAMQSRWSTFAEGLLRATVGLAEGALRRIASVGEAIGGGQVVAELATFDGDQLPSTIQPVWEIENDGVVDIDRQRVRVSTDGSSEMAIFRSFAFESPGTTMSQRRGRASIIVESHTADAFGRVGPVLYVEDGIKAAIAQLVEDGDAHAWVLTTDVVDSAPVIPLSAVHRVDSGQAHVVEIELSEGGEARLIIDGAILDRVPYASLVAAGDGPVVAFVSSFGVACVWTLERALMERRTTDMSRRPMFLQTVIERLIFVGGKERNDTLESARVHSWGLHDLRGTTNEILVELYAATVSVYCAVVTQTTHGDWFLELSYPEVTPIYLEFHGNLLDIFAEFPVGVVTMSNAEFAAWVARYLLPVSVLELKYHACLSTRLTANTATAGPLTQVIVQSTAGFEAGDTVTLHNAANTTQTTTTIDSISSTTMLFVVGGAVYLPGDTIRKTLADS